MIVGIGIDAVEISRFAHWYTFSQKQLQRIFSREEIEHCLQYPHLSAERFAARFAAREALFKALSPSHPQIKFLALCRAVTISANVPIITIAQSLPIAPSFTIHCSLSHTATTAVALIILEHL